MNDPAHGAPTLPVDEARAVRDEERFDPERLRPFLASALQARGRSDRLGTAR